MQGLVDRVLFITKDRIGDAVLSSGVLRHIVESEPRAQLTIVAGPTAAPLFVDTPRLEALIALKRRPHKLHWLDIWRRARGRRWTAVVDMRGSGLAYALSAERRLIYRSVRLTARSPPLHKVQLAGGVIGRLDDPPPPFLYTTAAREARADELVGRGGPILAIAPAANWAGKTWPAERFAETASELIGPRGPLAGGRALITGGPFDHLACEPIRAALPSDQVIDLVGLVDLLTIYACLKRARLFVGNDSGLMHLAACSGAPTLGLFGPTDPRVYRPWGPGTAFVAAGATSEDHLRATSDITGLSVDRVVRSARALLDRTQDVDTRGFAARASRSATMISSA